MYTLWYSEQMFTTISHHIEIWNGKNKCNATDSISWKAVHFTFRWNWMISSAPKIVGTRIIIQVNISANAKRHWQQCWIFGYLSWLSALGILVIGNILAVFATITIIKPNQRQYIQQAILMPFSLLLVFHSSLWWMHVFVNAVTYCNAFPFLF